MSYYLVQVVSHGIVNGCDYSLHDTAEGAYAAIRKAAHVIGFGHEAGVAKQDRFSPKCTGFGCSGSDGGYSAWKFDTARAALAFERRARLEF